jgi:hypothetical protein
MKRTRLLGLVLGLLASPSRAEGPRDAVVIHLVRPDQQCEALLNLFEGARAPHPAAALAGWKRATGETLGKAPEAVIALVNPQTVRELLTLDQAEVAFRLDPETGSLRWGARIPRDDGTVSALATALALTDGGQDAPIGTVPVDRLGPPGSPLMAVVDRRAVIGSTREDLHRLLNQGAKEGFVGDEVSFSSGFLIRLDPRGLDAPGPLWRRQLSAFLIALGASEVVATSGLSGPGWQAEASGRFDALPPIRATIGSDWLDAFPTERTLAAVALALDPSSQAWNTLFQALDAALKVDPNQAEAAPLRTRLNLVLLPTGISPEILVWPKLRGLSAGVLVSPRGMDGLLVVLHATDDAAAERLATLVVPRLTRWLGASSEPPETLRADPRPLGRLAGRDVSVSRRGRSVLVGWGSAVLSAGLATIDAPETSAGAVLRGRGDPVDWHHVGLFWPARWPWDFEADSPWVEALRASPSILWSGRLDGPATRDTIRVDGLRESVRRFLDSLPLDLPPETRP